MLVRQVFVNPSQTLSILATIVVATSHFTAELASPHYLLLAAICTLCEQGQRDSWRLLARACVR
eukprot:1238210-Amphidinium_carterae.1